MALRSLPASRMSAQLRPWRPLPASSFLWFRSTYPSEHHLIHLCPCSIVVGHHALVTWTRSPAFQKPTRNSMESTTSCFGRILQVDSRRSPWTSWCCMPSSKPCTIREYMRRSFRHLTVKIGITVTMADNANCGLVVHCVARRLFFLSKDLPSTPSPGRTDKRLHRLRRSLCRFPFADQRSGAILHCMIRIEPASLDTSALWCSDALFYMGFAALSI